MMVNGDQYFALSPQCFQLNQEQIPPYKPHVSCLQMLEMWVDLNVCCLVETQEWVVKSYPGI